MVRHGIGMLGVVVVLLSWTALLMQSSEAQECGSAVNDTACQDGLCCSEAGYCGASAEYCGAGCQSHCISNAPPRDQPKVISTSGLDRVLTARLFEKLWPDRNRFYQYTSLILAGNAFPLFGSSGDEESALREIAAFAAHVQQETSGLVYITEIDKSGNYCDPTFVQYPCAKNRTYYGRGPVQLSWNFNYGAASRAVGRNILANPDRVAKDPVLAFKTALWFWTTPSGTAPSIHDVLTGSYVPTKQDKQLGRLPGFGLTINIINGALECGKATPQAANRITYFRQFCALLGVDPGPHLTCEKMTPF